MELWMKSSFSTLSIVPINEFFEAERGCNEYMKGLMHGVPLTELQIKNLKAQMDLNGDEMITPLECNKWFETVWMVEVKKREFLEAQQLLNYRE